MINCRECGFFAEKELCAICSESCLRDRSVLCVVEQPTDILPLERTGAFNGVYHALAVSSLNDARNQRLALDAGCCVNAAPPSELIFALGADVEGEATASYLSQLLAGIELRVTRLAQGLPAGLGPRRQDYKYHQREPPADERKSEAARS